MTRRGRTLAVFLWLSCLAGEALGATGAAAIVAEMPAPDAERGQALAKRIIDLGPGAVREICGMLKEPGKGDDAKARVALHGLALYVVRPGAEAERRTYEGALIEALEAESRPELEAFLIRQLQLVGGDRAVRPLAKLLADDRLCEPATQALLRISTREAVAALRRALPSAKGRNLVTIVRALGRLRDKSSARAIIPHASSSDQALRRAAWYALANIGEASAAGILAKAAQSKGTYERVVGTESYLLLARRLAEGRGKRTCARICRELIRTRTAPRENNVVCAALGVLARALGAEATEDLVAAADHKDKRIREAALRFAEGLPGRTVTERWIARARSVAAPEARAAIVEMLGRRGDRSALGAVAAALRDKDKTVRLAAVSAVARFGPEDAVGPLAEMMKSDQADEVKAVKSALSWLGGRSFSAAVAAGIAGASVPGRVALLELLAERRATDQVEAVLKAAADTDAGVRLAAIRALETVAGPGNAPRIIEFLLGARDSRVRSAASKVLVTICRNSADGAAPVLAALDGAGKAGRAVLLGALARIGGAGAMRAVLADVSSADAAVREAAVRALADWRDAEAAPELIRLARAAGSDTHRTLALRGYVRVAGLASKRPPERTVAMLGEAMAAARTSAEKKLVLGALGKIRHVAALGLVAASFDDEAVKEEAAAAAVRIACPAGRRDKGLRGSAVGEVLERVVNLTRNAGVRDKARKHLAAIPKADALNLAQGRPVRASVGHQGNCTPQKAVDGNTDRGAAWFGNKWPCWLHVDLQRTVRIGGVHVFFYWDGTRYYQYTVEVSQNARAWRKVVDMSRGTRKATAEGFVHKFSPVGARYVRLNVLKNSSNPAVHVSEFKVYAEGKVPKGRR